MINIHKINHTVRLGEICGLKLFHPLRDSLANFSG
jgi:hypothetical protein